MTINMGKSAASFSESDFDWRHKLCSFFANSVLHHPPQGEGFQAVSNYKFSAVVKFQFSRRNLLSTTEF